MTYPAVIFWILSFLCLRSRGPSLYRLFFVSWSFGMLAMLPPQAVGVSLFPVWIILGFLTVRTVMDVGYKAYLAALFDFRRFGVLTLCTLYTLFSGIMLPRIFAGRIDVITMRLETLGATGLAPSVSNIIQAAYFVLTTLLVVNIYFAASDPERRKALLEGFTWGAVAAIVTGLIDLAFSAVGLSSLLEPYRNAAYVLLTDNEVGDMRRVVGLTSEASAYASLCVSFLAPLAITPQDRASAPWGRWRAPLVAGLLIMTYLSTSSGGYVALGCVAMVVLAGVGLGLIEGRRPAWRAAYWMMMLGVAGLGVAVFAPQVVDTLAHMLDLVVFQKAQTTSYVERSMWNTMAFQAFLHSGGLGAGIGCCRTSSWVFAVLGNIGVPGGALMLGFMVQVFLARAADPSDRGLLRIAKLAILPALFVISLTSPSVNFGLGAGWLFGLAMALARPAASRRALQAAADPAAGAPRRLTAPNGAWRPLALPDRRPQG
jgi:hypothetical protein